MGNRYPLSLTEKEGIYLGKLQGQTLVKLAAEVGCSLGCVRKWWRVARDRGLTGLRAARQGRGRAGPVSQFDARVAPQAVGQKRAHPGWGADRVLVALASDPALSGLRLPSRSRLAALFKAQCPECVAQRQPRQRREYRLPAATSVHELWQLDSQEKIVLHNGEIATICTVRDPVGAAMIASRAFAVQTARHWRKLTWTEVRQVLREGFTEWQTMPDAVQTDNELGLAGGPNDPFPGHLTLWLVGLGITHHLIHPGRPTEQAEVERNHRTLDNWALDEQACADIGHLQHALDRERRVHNQQFPTRASDCARRPPLTAHPELLHPRRPYQPDAEWVLFDVQRVYAYLATFTFTRAVSGAAQVSLGRQLYSLGKPQVRQLKLRSVLVRLDPADKQWVFYTDPGQELVRRPLKGMDALTLTGLEPPVACLTQPIQLTLPFLVA
jgi:hypothetical protein